MCSIGALLLMALMSCAATASAQAATGPVPIVYSSDLMHPHDDPDDHFDLACLYAMPQLDPKAIILDNGASQKERPGFTPVWQLNYLTGRHVPAATGLDRKLKAPDDPAWDQPAENQNGVHLLLQTLRDSREKVTLIFVGSARDIAVAYNREPTLLRNKVRGVYGFIGEASDPEFIEYNVSLDPLAFVRLLRSDLPFYWIPCFDGGLWQNKGHASYWKIRHGDVLEKAPEPLQRFFLYMLRKDSSDPIASLAQPIPAQDRQWLMGGERNLWAAALLGLCAEKSPVDPSVAGFSPVDVSVSANGVVSYGKQLGSRQVMRFEIRDKASFAPVCTARTAELLTSFPIARSGWDR